MYGIYSDVIILQKVSKHRMLLAFSSMHLDHVELANILNPII